jgi:hypothetical protein
MNVILVIVYMTGLISAGNAEIVIIDVWVVANRLCAPKRCVFARIVVKTTFATSVERNAKCATRFVVVIVNALNNNEGLSFCCDCVHSPIVS